MPLFLTFAAATVLAADPPIRALAPLDTPVIAQKELVGVSVAADGTAYVSDSRQGRVLRVPTSGRVTPAVVNLERPIGVAVDGDGRVLIAQEKAGTVIRLEANGTLTTMVTGLRKPGWLALGDDGALYVSAVRILGRDGTDADEVQIIVRRDPITAALTAVAANIRRVESLVLNGSFYAAAKRAEGLPDVEGAVVRFSLNPDGTLSDPGYFATSAFAERPIGLVMDRLGALYVTSGELRIAGVSRKHAVGKVHQNGTVTVFAYGLADPRGVALGPDGSLWLADGHEGRVVRFAAPSAPVLDPLPAVSPSGTVTVAGRAPAGARVDIFVDDTPTPVSATAGVEGRFSATVAVAPHGSSTVQVFATAHGGNGLTSPPTTATITHDGVAPSLSFQAPPASAHVRGHVPLQAQATDAGGAVASVTLIADSTTLTTTSTPAPPAPAVTATAMWDTTIFVDGGHTLTAVATDQAGNATTATRVVISDNTPPTVAITSGPSGDVTQTSALFTFSGTDNVTSPAQLVYAFRVDEGTWGAFSPATTASLTGLTAGPHTLRVKARDVAGNETAVPASRSFTVVLAPVITGVSPAVGARGVTTRVTVSGTNLAGTSLSRSGATVTNTVSTSTTVTADLTLSVTAPREGVVTVATQVGSATAAFGAVPGPPAITGFTPVGGAVGDTVTVNGSGFDEVTPADNVVRFNGVAAEIITVQPVQLLTRVPAAATTGPITVTTAAGTATSATDFTVASAPGVTVLATISAPFSLTTDMKLNADRSRAYVLDAGRDRVAVVDTSTHAIVATIPAGDFPSFSVLSPDGTRLYVVDDPIANVNVHVLDLTTNTRLATIPLASSSPGPIALTPDGRTLYVGHRFETRVSVVDVPSGTVSTLAVEATGGVEMSPSGAHVFLNGNFAVSIVDTATRSIVATLPSGVAGPPAIGRFSPDGRRYYSVSTSEITVIDAESFTVLTEYASRANNPQAVLMSDDGTRLYVAATSSALAGNGRALVEIDLATNTPTRALALPLDPLDVQYTANRTRLLVPIENDNVLLVVDPATMTAAATIPLDGTRPAQVAALADDRLVYLRCRDSDTVCVVDLLTNSAVSVPVARTGAAQDRLVFGPGGDRAYGRENTAMAGFNPATLQPLPNIRVPRAPTRPAPQVVSLAIDPVTGGRLYFDNSRQIVFADTATGAILGVVNSTSAPSTFMFPTVDGTRLLVLSSTRLMTIDVATRTETSSLVVGAVTHAALSPDGARLYVADATAGAVKVYETAGPSLIATIPVAATPFRVGLSGDSQRVALLSTGATPGLSVIDATTNTVIAAVALPAGTYRDLALSPTRPLAFAANATTRRVEVVALDTPASLASILLGVAPESLAVSSTGAKVFVVQFGGTGTDQSQISVLDGGTAALLGSAPITTGTNGPRVTRGPGGRAVVTLGLGDDNMLVIE